MATMLRLTQVRSIIGCTDAQRATVRSLGLRRIRQEVVRPDSPDLRGMIRRVAHLVRVEELSAAEAAAASAAAATSRATAPVAAPTESAAKVPAAAAPAKKAAAKKAPAKKAPAAKAPAKKAAAKKAPATKAPAKNVRLPVVQQVAIGQLDKRMALQISPFLQAGMLQVLSLNEGQLIQEVGEPPQRMEMDGRVQQRANKNVKHAKKFQKKK
jgi:ribosomal protein L30